MTTLLLVCAKDFTFVRHLNETVLVLILCACREMLEESGLCVSELDKVGVILFEFVREPQLMEVHVFRTNQYEGEPRETEGIHNNIIWLFSAALCLTHTVN